MSVHRTSDGRWFVQWRDKSVDYYKKRRYFGRGPDAEEKARAFDESLNLGKQGPKKLKSPYFSDLVNEYTAAKVTEIVGVNMDNFLTKMKGVILPQFGNILAINLTPQRMDAYVKWRVTESRVVMRKNKNGETVKRIFNPVSNTTVHRELSDIQSVLNFAVQRGRIAFNPLGKYKAPPRDDAPTIPPSMAEVQAIMRHAPDRLKRMVALAYYTGVRPGAVELNSIRWDHVDFRENTIMVRSARKGNNRFRRPTLRLIPIHSSLLPLLKRWKLKDSQPNGHIIHYRGKPVYSMKKVWTRTKKKAGISRRLRMYDLRHLTVSTLLKNGADLKATSELAGHSRTETTTRIYQHTDLEMHRAAIESLPALDLGSTEPDLGNPTEMVTEDAA